MTHRSWHTLAFLLVLGSAFGLLSWWVPEDGLKFAGFTIDFPHREADDQPVVAPEDIAALLDSYEQAATENVSKIDSLEAVVKIPEMEPLPQPKPTGVTEAGLETTVPDRLLLKGSSRAWELLHTTFARIDSLSDTTLHVFHFGDSQIEGDRITGHLRNTWQKRWGGGGPGYLPAVSQVPSLAAKQTAGEQWERKTLFGRRDTAVRHMRYGILSTIGVWEPLDSLETTDSLSLTTDFHVRPHPYGYRLNRNWNTIELVLGATDSTTLVQCAVDSFPTMEAYAKPDTATSTVRFAVHQPGDVALVFPETKPEVNAIGLWRDRGLVVHNVPMRGSSGTLFRRTDRDQYARQLAAHSVGLIMLQFGGNSVPYISDTTSALRYGNWFASQIRQFKKWVPGVPIIVIGPSDMSMKDGDRFITYPLLESVRDALREASLGEDALYWDLFEVMGGRNAMPAWVASEPSLASSDHVHFTTKGARRVAELFDQGLMGAWMDWKAKPEIQEP